jgi:TRAP transporter 4TM/12TM fusion protein
MGATGSGDEAAKAQTLLEKADRESKTRTYRGIFAPLMTVFSIVWVIFQLYFNTLGSMDAISFRAWHAMFLLLYCFILYPAYKKENRRRRLPGVFDFVLIGATLFAFLYFVLNYRRISLSGGYVTQAENIIGVIAIVLSFIAAWRAAGGLVWLAALFMAYNFLGRYIPGALGHAGFSVNRIVGHMFWSSQGLFSAGIGVSTTYIFVFILFGAFLAKSGFTNFINNFSLALVGRTAGGPAKVGVIACGLMGMINGSAVAIVATTGTIAIPMMRKAGYTKDFSAAVIAAAASGGQYCPPVMGAVAFLMAEFLGVSYSVVLLAAIVPAALYYIGLLLAVHFQARRSGLKGLSPENIPRALEVLKKEGYLLAPLVSLLVFMGIGFTPLFACIISIFVTVAASWVRSETRMGLRKIIAACEDGARGAVSVGVCCVIIGVIVGTVSLTGLGLKFGFLMLKVVDLVPAHYAQLKILTAAFMIAVMSTILGMGVPGIAAFVIVTAVAIPVMLQVGCSPIPAYLFCLYYASLSNITPPVAISAYVAAGIADSNQNKTGWLAVRVGLSGFLLPFYFLINPVLLIGAAPEGTAALTVIRSIAGAAIGIFALASGTEGWLLKKSGRLERLLCIAASLLLIDPGLITDLAGIGLLLIVFAFQCIHRRSGGGMQAAV